MLSDEAAPSDTDEEYQPSELATALDRGSQWLHDNVHKSRGCIGCDICTIRSMMQIAAERLSRSQPVQVEPWGTENLQIVNGWLVERGAHPLDYPAGAAYGAMPYSDAEPLLNLSEIPGWPVQVEVTTEMTEKAERALSAQHWDGTGCGTHGANGCSNCFGPSPLSASEIVALVLSAALGSGE